MSDTQKDTNLSRKDFFKVVGVGAAAIAGIRLGIEYGDNSYSMAAKVCNKLTYAELNNDPKEIQDAKKLAFVWLFAETARRYGKNEGFEKAGEALGHYMYGKGQDLDVSSWLSEEGERPEFWKRLFSDMQNSIGEENSNPLNSTRMLKNRLENGYKFIGKPDSSDLYSAIGYSEYTLKSRLEYKYDQDLDLIHNKTLKESELSMEDAYDWDIENSPASLGNIGSYFVSGLFYEVKEAMLSSDGAISKTIDSLNLSSLYKEQLTEIYEFGVTNLLRDATKKVDDGIVSIENWAGGKDNISEKDLSLLESVGAKSYRIYGSLHYPNVVSVDQ